MTICGSARRSGDQLIKLRARALVVATGAHDLPLPFENNDLPGVMLGSGVLRLARLWGVIPGSRAVVVSAQRRGLQTALDLHALGVGVAAVIDARPNPDPDLVAQLTAAGIDGARGDRDHQSGGAGSRPGGGDQRDAGQGGLRSDRGLRG